MRGAPVAVVGVGKVGRDDTNDGCGGFQMRQVRPFFWSGRESENSKHMQIPFDISELQAALIAQREYTLALYEDLPDVLWEPARVPKISVINPPLWELSHIAWFQENFALRVPALKKTGVKPPSCFALADSLFDSSKVAHASRWANTYPSRDKCMRYMRDTLAQTLAALEASAAEDRHYFQLVLAHEDMHGEALAMTLTVLGLPLPDVVPKRKSLKNVARDITFSGGAITLGECDRDFQFDNELPPQRMEIASFAIASECVSTSEFAAFADSAAYQDDRLWSAEGVLWRNRFGRKKAESFDGLAAMHISYFEAEAYCRGINRRLPTESEWEFAAVNSAEFAASIGHVWEWSASVFAPRPGFERGVYQEYSEPWFGNHQVLKGGSFVTQPRMMYPQYRNFYMRDRLDMFCGFRTCAK
jgi:gamma-glutamyl hercynylcysteine S-oxide synthase